MNFEYKGAAYSINCDWLQYSVLLDCTEPKMSCPEGYRVDVCQGNNVFEKRALVMDNCGRKILTLLWKPYSIKVLNPLLMTVQVANEGLYTNNILNSLQLVKSITKCTYNGIGRFDICCDFSMNEKKFQMVKHLNSGHYYVERKSEGSAFWHEVKRNDHKHKVTHCLSWGSKHSEIKVKLYDKTRELGITSDSMGEKPWIVREWDKIGVDRNNAWRLEFSLTSNGQLRYNERQITLDDLANPYWLACVYIDLYYTRFVTRINQGKKKGHHNGDEKVFLIILPTDAAKLYWASNTNERTESAPAIKLLRTLLGQIDNEALVADKDTFKQYSDTILNVVATYGLEDYCSERLGVSCADFLDSCYKQAGSGVNEHILSLNRLLN